MCIFTLQNAKFCIDHLMTKVSLNQDFLYSSKRGVDINLGVIFKMYILSTECQKENQRCAIPKNLKPKCCEGLTCMAMNGTTNECVKLDGKHLYTLQGHTFVFACLLNLVNIKTD